MQHMDNALLTPAASTPSYLPTYTSDFRCPECDRVLPRSVTSSVGPRLERCGCGYDPALPQSLSPIPIS